ncbi:LOW QUALITY PROTEIN: DNA replication complex GINS protein PSF3 [Gopherus flavomarginatus]|uniref:LOW QUALITY PROTEIN: DNA replication complex GINS protein PSF3 n=1 Tax=Gopherus flavomarginatus TaxID=286002 RepID=UPI0021CBFCA8|nr:LOW QUALITY PROTEIN: DNA replication complex GINS protein PSF3 [Gopherus flavomarginatus]
MRQLAPRQLLLAPPATIHRAGRGCSAAGEKTPPPRSGATSLASRVATANCTHTQRSYLQRARHVPAHARAHPLPTGSPLDCSGLALLPVSGVAHACCPFLAAASAWQRLRARRRRPAMAEAYFPVGPGVGPEENFLSLEDILMSQEKLPGRVEAALPRLAAVLGKGAAAGQSDGIPEGSKVEIPLWLAKGLYDNKRRILSVELPKIYKEGWRTVFSADANVVDLHKMGPYYYSFGSQLLNFDNPENPEIAQTILQTFIGRFRRIMDSSQNAYNEDTSALVARLDELERALFRAGQKGLNDFQCWEKGQASQITASSLVQNYRKRKFTDMDG